MVRKYPICSWSLRITSSSLVTSIFTSRRQSQSKLAGADGSGRPSSNRLSKSGVPSVGFVNFLIVYSWTNNARLRFLSKFLTQQRQHFIALLLHTTHPASVANTLAEAEV